ncbi:hypothetical protein GGS26DRAFT_589446 [Hypomontagnella submonticulosa]|nr:hypothetical protein GGS26DRAFT_589446 [Hypomontagnella submonticulosa]
MAGVDIHGTPSLWCRGDSPVCADHRTAMLYYVPESPELIFRGHHHTIDGTSVLLFCTATLAPQLKDIEFGDELAWPIPIVEEVLASNLSQDPAALEGRCRNTKFVFSAETTKAVVAACKARGVSVSAAVHAAYVRAIAKNADRKSKLRHYGAILAKVAEQGKGPQDGR